MAVNRLGDLSADCAWNRSGIDHDLEREGLIRRALKVKPLHGSPCSIFGVRLRVTVSGLYWKAIVVVWDVFTSTTTIAPLFSFGSKLDDVMLYLVQETPCRFDDL